MSKDLFGRTNEDFAVTQEREQRESQEMDDWHQGVTHDFVNPKVLSNETWLPENYLSETVAIDAKIKKAITEKVGERGAESTLVICTFSCLRSVQIIRSGWMRKMIVNDPTASTCIICPEDGAIDKTFVANGPDYDINEAVESAISWINGWEPRRPFVAPLFYSAIPVFPDRTKHATCWSVDIEANLYCEQMWVKQAGSEIWVPSCGDHIQRTYWREAGEIEAAAVRHYVTEGVLSREEIESFIE